MANIPQVVLEIFVINLLIGATCLYFGFRTKRSFKSLLLFAGVIEIVGVAIFLVVALHEYGLA